MWPFSRRGASGFNWYSTAEQVTEGLDGSGLTAIVTGKFSHLSSVSFGSLIEILVNGFFFSLIFVSWFGQAKTIIKSKKNLVFLQPVSLRL